MLSSVFFIIIVGIAYGHSIESNNTYNKSSDYFFAHDDQSIQPNEIWTADIQPMNVTNETRIFVVIEKMILYQQDTVEIVSGNTTPKIFNSSHDPFSFLVDGPKLKIVVTSSNIIAPRKFIGYYTSLGCTYQIHETFGILSTPILYTIGNTANCNFLIGSQFEAFSKLSVTFRDFHLNKNMLQVIINGTHYHNYSGDITPPEIITGDKLELNFTLSKNDTAKFEYKNVLKESEFVELNNKEQSHKFIYSPSPIAGDYLFGEECHWIVKSEEDTTISFKFFNITFPSGATHITLKDGKNQFSSTLFYLSSNDVRNVRNRVLSSSGNFLWISLVQPDKNTSLIAEVTMHRNGGYQKGNGKLVVPLNSTEVIYLLEENSGENVVLDGHKGNLTSNSTIYVYNDFYYDSAPIIIYNTSLPHYPIVSSTSKMMIIARNFTENSSYEASFRGINEGCYKMSVESGEYLLSGNCNTTCKWIVPPVQDADGVISFHIHLITFEKQDDITLSLLDAAQTLITNITSYTNMLPEFYLPSSSGFLLNIVRGNCSVTSDMLHATFEKIKGCNSSHELKPGSHFPISSPNFPNSYPLWADCWTNITATNGTKNGHFLLTFNKIDLATTHCLKIRDNFTSSNVTIQIYEGKQEVLPGDMILSDSASVEFLAQPCNSTEKHLNQSTSSGFFLDILSSDCGEKISKTEGNFSTPDFPKNTSIVICTWILEVPKKDISKNLTNIINITLIKNDSKDFELEIYDGPSLRNETIKNNSASSLLSRTNSLVFVYRRNADSQTSPGIQIKFHSQTCSTTCQNGLCLHDDWKCNGHNDCGDNSDEIDCKTSPYTPTLPPSPPPENKSYGVSPVALGLGIPIAFILGICAAIYLPPIIRRFRSGQYHQFRDVSADA